MYGVDSVGLLQLDVSMTWIPSDRYYFGGGMAVFQWTVESNNSMAWIPSHCCYFM